MVSSFRILDDRSRRMNDDSRDLGLAGNSVRVAKMDGASALRVRLIRAGSIDL